MKIQPYSDEFMIYDEKSKRYVLTEKCITTEISSNILSEISTFGATSPQSELNNLLKKVSRQVYGYIFKFNDMKIQEYLINHYESAREIVKQAMIEQFSYIYSVGLLRNSDDKAKQELYFSEDAKDILLNYTVDGLGLPLTYGGDLTKYVVSLNF